MDDSKLSLRLGRILAIFLALFITIEALSRIIVVQFADAPFKSLSLYKWSPYGLVRNNPDLTSPDFLINANGFRAIQDYQRIKPDNTFRVLLLGGSVLYSGLGGNAKLEKYGRVNSAHTIAPYLQKIMENDPAFSGAKIEVINGAVNFNRIVEISSAYLEEYIHWSPDYVVVFGSVNNFSRVRFAGEQTLQQTTLQSPHAWRPEFERLVNDYGLPASLERVWRSGAEHSAALALSLKITSKIADYGVKISQRGAVHPQPVEQAMETLEESKSYFNIFATYADAMSAAAKRRNHGISFVWEPMLSDLGKIKPMSEEETRIFPAVQRSAKAVAQYDGTRKQFNAYFKKQGVAYVDPTDALKSHNQTVYIDYAHYTPEGNSFIAGVVFKSLRDGFLRHLKSK
ncbi:MAG: hypothetical protein JKX91_01445 [Rhizobiaceae bacterium]|nr:hypothetical protein [Rhizobiaceae bacterium]